MLREGYRGDWQWTRNGAVVASISIRSEAERVILHYRYGRGGDEWQDLEYPVRIERTPCHLGGSRPWFICPGRGCGRRAAVLYGGAVYACRHCHELVYPSTREHVGDRLARRADRIRERLGWRAGILNPPGSKPKWMRWDTYRRLREEHNRLVHGALSAMAVNFGIFEPWLDPDM
jgi:hypothetical protein